MLKYGMRWILLSLSSFYMIKNSGPERLRNLPKVTQLGSDGAGVQSQSSLSMLLSTASNIWHINVSGCV